MIEKRDESVIRAENAPTEAEVQAVIDRVGEPDAKPDEAELARQRDERRLRFMRQAGIPEEYIHLDDPATNPIWNGDAHRVKPALAHFERGFEGEIKLPTTVFVAHGEARSKPTALAAEIAKVALTIRRPLPTLWLKYSHLVRVFGSYRLEEEAANIIADAQFARLIVIVGVRDVAKGPAFDTNWEELCVALSGGDRHVLVVADPTYAKLETGWEWRQLLEDAKTVAFGMASNTPSEPKPLPEPRPEPMAPAAPQTAREAILKLFGGDAQKRLAYAYFTKALSGRFAADQIGPELNALKEEGALRQTDGRYHLADPKQPAKVEAEQGLTYAGRTQSLTEWSEELGIARTTLWRRLKTQTLDQIMGEQDVERE